MSEAVDDYLTANLKLIEAIGAGWIIGHGGYHFGDYWRMGLPLEVLIVAVSLPMLLWVWPL